MLEQLKSKRPLIAIVILAVMLVAVGAWWFLGPRFEAAPREITTSGTIEADEVAIVPEIGGRVVAVNANQGDEVRAGQVLVRLDDTLIAAQIGQAEAALAMARSKEDMVRRGTRAEDREAARAALAQAVSAREGAYRAWQDAQAILDKPQELDAKIDDARAQLALSEKQVETAKAQIEMAKTRRDVFNGAGSDEGKTQYLVYDKQVQAAEQALLAAQATRDAAQTSLNALLAMRADPIALRAQVHTAKTQYESAKATADAAQAAFDVIVAGPTVEEVAVAQAQREQAEAALAVLQVQRDKMRLITPVDGLVVEHSVHVGETASVGSTLMTVASLDVVKLTIYVPTDRIGLVRVGQRAEVTVDSFPGRIFVGQVTYISPQAEFTPKNVQTREERVKTVFAVRITLPNPDHSLKPGMSADARALADAGLVPTTTSTP